MVHKQASSEGHEKKGHRAKEGGSMTKHNCGGGYVGHIVRSHGIVFCGFCGKEFKK